MALDPDDATLYVSTGASHSLVAFAVTATALEGRARFSLRREPRAVLVTSWSAGSARVRATSAALERGSMRSMRSTPIRCCSAGLISCTARSTRAPVSAASRAAEGPAGRHSHPDSERLGRLGDRLVHLVAGGPAHGATCDARRRRGGAACDLRRDVGLELGAGSIRSSRVIEVNRSSRATRSRWWCGARSENS